MRGKSCVCERERLCCGVDSSYLSSSYFNCPFPSFVLNSHRLNHPNKQALGQGIQHPTLLALRDALFRLAPQQAVKGPVFDFFIRLSLARCVFLGCVSVMRVCFFGGRGEGAGGMDPINDDNALPHL